VARGWRAVPPQTGLQFAGGWGATLCQDVDRQWSAAGGLAGPEGAVSVLQHHVWGDRQSLCYGSIGACMDQIATPHRETTNGESKGNVCSAILDGVGFWDCLSESL